MMHVRTYRYKERSGSFEPTITAKHCLSIEGKPQSPCQTYNSMFPVTLNRLTRPSFGLYIGTIIAK